MALKARLSPLAQRHARQIIMYYHQQKPGLEARFLTELRALVGRISTHPQAFPLIEGTRRRRAVFTGKFPYVILYRLTRSEVVITAIAHQRQSRLRKKRK